MAAAAEEFLCLEEAWTGFLIGVQLTHTWREPRAFVTRHPWVWRVPNHKPRWRRGAWSGIMIESMEE